MYFIKMTTSTIWWIGLWNQDVLTQNEPKVQDQTYVLGMTGSSLVLPMNQLRLLDLRYLLNVNPILLFMKRSMSEAVKVKIKWSTLVKLGTHKCSRSRKYPKCVLLRKLLNNFFIYFCQTSLARSVFIHLKCHW